MREKRRVISVGVIVRTGQLAAVAACLAAVSLPAAAQVVIGKNVQISRARPDNAHYETIVAADPLNAQRLIAASHIYYEETGGSAIDPAFRQSSIVYVSFDGGKSWEISLEPKNHEAAGVDPAVAYGPDGAAHFATLGRYTLYRSPDGGKTWDKPAMIPEAMGLDREYLVADFNKESPHYGNLYMNGNVFPSRLTAGSGDGTGFGLYTSRDGGKTYRDPVSRIVYQPQSMGPMGNSVVLSNGTVVSLFAVVKDVALSRPPPDQRMPGPNATLYLIRSEDGGVTLTPPTYVSDYWTHKVRSQGAVVPWLAVDPGSSDFKDRLYAVWTDFRSGRLEILLSHSSDRGKSWSAPQVINDDRRPVNPLKGPDSILPTVAVNKDGVVVVVWYDRRESPDNLGWHMRVRASLDGGETWLASQKVSEKPHTFDGHERWSLSTEAGADGLFFLQSTDFNFYFSPGHTSGLAAGADGVFHPVWVDNRTGVAQLWTAPISVNARAAKNGGGELAGLVDLGAQIAWELVGQKQVRERGRDQMVYTVRLKNVSDTLLRPTRLKLRLLQMQSAVAAPRVVGADNGQNGPGAVWDFAPTIPSGGLAPGAVGQEKDLVFALEGVRPFQKDVDRLNNVLQLQARLLGELASAPDAAK